jgi:hypothetical protein
MTVTHTVTIPPVTPISTIQVSVEETPEPTVTAEEPDWEPIPTVIPTANPDLANQNFSQFVSDDFMAKYPQDWAVVCQTFTLDDTTLYGQDIWKEEGRIVSFVSEDGKTKMMVSIRDFRNPGPNRYTFRPTIDSARKSVAMLFPNASSETSVYNFQYKKNDQQIFTSRYDVIFTPDSEYFPYTYTEETWTTQNHMFNVDFIVINGLTLNDYKELKYYMMKNILTEGNQARKWW